MTPDTPLARAEAIYGVRLPDDFRALYAARDGQTLPWGRLLKLAEIADMAEFFPVGLVPFTDREDSNPHAVCCREPLAGCVAHLFHDDESRLVSRSVGAFLVSAAAGDWAGELAFEVPERTAADAEAARALARQAAGMPEGDLDRGQALRFAAHLFGPGDEAELLGLIELGDGYTRDSALERLAGIGTPAARDAVRAEAAALNRFIDGLAASLEAEGLRLERERGRPREWSVEPGRIHLNFPMLYAQRRGADFLPELVARIRGWQAGR